MTTQVREELLYEGKQVSMCSTPLSDFFAMADSKPTFAHRSTACWRGYIGQWEITDNRLFLIGLKATLRDGSPVSVATIFPYFTGRIFANWYTGTLHIPEGELIQYFHGGFESVYERDLFLDIKEGVVVDTRLVKKSVSVHALDI
jgi:hypothetical protein